MLVLQVRGAPSSLVHNHCRTELKIFYNASNLTFGTGGKDKDGKNVVGWGYYETIAGGSGAGPGWHGTSGVHTHITNTRIGDVEILERRYPLMLHQFGIRSGSGGAGEWRGGDGAVREIEFLQPIQVSILSEVRVHFSSVTFGLCAYGELGRGGRDSRMVWKVGNQAPLGSTPGSSNHVKKMVTTKRVKTHL